ncbi:MAG: hypothetical protein R3B93_03285 [Bacteroidia bacterium]
MKTQFSHTHTVETANCYFFWEPEGILNLVSKPNSHTTLERAIEENDAVVELTNGQPLF